MTDQPVCECHGVAMYWHKRKDMIAGGNWRCRERRKAFDAARWQGYYYERMPPIVRARQLMNATLSNLARDTERARERAHKQGAIGG